MNVCDNCSQPVVTRGVDELEYVHVATGSVFCTKYVATVNGRNAPEKLTPERVLVIALTQITETLAGHDALSVGEQASIILAALHKAGFAIGEQAT